MFFINYASSPRLSSFYISILSFPFLPWLCVSPCVLNSVQIHHPCRSEHSPSLQYKTEKTRQESLYDHIPISPLPPPAIPNLCQSLSSSLLVKFCHFKNLYKWTHTAFNFWDVFLTYHNSFEIQPNFYLYQ